MICTEQEAKNKDCPLAPLVAIASTHCGEPPTDLTSWCKCSASKCMWWRWNVEQAMPRRIMHSYSEETKEPSRRPEEVPKGWVFRPCVHHSTRYEPAYWFEPKDMHEERMKDQLPLRGYCGLAGKPGGAAWPTQPS